MDPAIIIWVLILLGVIVIVIRSRSLKRKNIGAPPPDLWRDYRSGLDGYERELRGFRIVNFRYRQRPLARMACHHNLCRSRKLKRCFISMISRMDMS